MPCAPSTSQAPFWTSSKPSPCLARIHSGPCRTPSSRHTSRVRPIRARLSTPSNATFHRSVRAALCTTRSTAAGATEEVDTVYQTAIDPAIVAEITPVFREELKACAIRPGDAICLFTDARSNPFYVAAFFSAAKDLDATCFQIKVPYMVESTRMNPRAHAED